MSSATARYTGMPAYVLWGPILQEAIIGFIERAGWKPTDVIGFWTHKDAPGEHGYLQAFELTQDWLFDDGVAAAEGEADAQPVQEP